MKNQITDPVLIDLGPDTRPGLRQEVHFKITRTFWVKALVKNSMCWLELMDRRDRKFYATEWLWPNELRKLARLLLKLADLQEQQSTGLIKKIELKRIKRKGGFEL